MRKSHVAIVALALTAGACGWVEEQRQRARRAEARERAETAVVDWATANNVAAVREEIEKDRTLANSRRTVKNDGESYQTETALTAAIKEGHREMVVALLALGANPNLADHSTSTP